MAGDGTLFRVEIGAGDIEGFDPSRDKLDLGGVSVHNFIPVDTPRGAGFMNPWSGETVVIAGVSLGQLTVDNFAPVENDHLRQCLSGALAWEQAEALGTAAEPGVVFARSHEVGRIDRVAFDPATDVVDFRHYGTREQLSMVDGAEGVVISNAGTGQALILLGVSVAELTVENFRFYSAQVREDRLHLQLGVGPVPDAQILPIGAEIAGTNDWPTEAGPGTPPSGVEGRVFEIDWRWGEAIVLDFDPAADSLDFGWFRAAQFSVTEEAGSVVIAIDGNRQTYTLTGVSLGMLEMSNIAARDESARAEWRALLDAAAPAPTVSVADASADEGAGRLVFVVTLSEPASAPVEVDWATTAGTARAGEDYAAALGTLVFAAGETRKTVEIAVQGDALHELDETLGLRLSAARGARLGDAEALGTIRDDDPDTAPGTPPAIAVADLEMAEGDAGHTHLHILLTLSKASDLPVTVNYALVDGTARAGSDYAAQSGAVTFAPGETTAAIHANGIGDLVAEGDETFRVVLSGPVNATLADGEATVTLIDDDEAAPPPEVSIADARVTEGDAGGRAVTLTLTLSEPAAGPVTVDWATVDGTARAGSDYAAASGRVSFAAGETSAAITVQVTGDLADEADERFAVRLSSPSGAVLGRAEATVTIADDDEAPAPGDGAVDYVVRSDWGAGFVADLTVGGGAAGLDGWRVAFRADFEITNIWNARIVSHVGDLYVLENMGYNARVSAGGVTGFGFQAGGGAAASLSGLTLNGEDAGGGSGGDGDPLPTLSVAAASAGEGDGWLDFAVTLSAASDTPVTVRYATEDGTARAGQDYAAASGTLTFAAGETAKTVRVAVLDDAAHEGEEAMSLALSSPSGATLNASRATGAIVDDDPAPLPGISIGDAHAAEGAMSEGDAPGWFSTQGNRIVDADGETVRIAGVNWFGFESSTLAPHGLWTRGYAEMMDQMVSLGFNTIRLPFSSEMLRTSAAPNGIDFSKNPDLAGLSAIEIMDRIVDYAGEVGLRVILDHHRSTSGAGTSGNGLWFGEGGHTEASWIEDWRMLAARYADDPTVIGADLHNEPHGGTWGGGGATDWARAAEAAGDAIGAVNPNWLIFVEGVGAYQGDSYWWGGALQGVRDRPIELEVANKLVYSPHDYGNSVHAQSWFQQPGFEDDLDDVFREAWGFIQEEGIAPVMVGEFGTRLQDPKDEPWLAALTAYMAGDYDLDGDIDLGAGEEGISWTYWSWNPNSGDTGGILADDWRTVHDDKMAYLEPIRFDLPDAGEGGGRAVFEVTLSAPSEREVSVGWRTLPGSASEDDFEAAAGVLTFAPGETSQRIVIDILADDLAEETEDFLVVLTGPEGAVLDDATGRGLIEDQWNPEADAMLF
ncbi:MAG: Calx-beta domain-containing protein [Pseudomonadota bacterium]|nr:Calx-beta domain-containing protein [Pseudomonadota bacterium]